MTRSCRNGVLAFLFGFVSLGAALAVALPSAATAGSGVPLPNPPRAFKGDKCVEPVPVMVREHMDFLLHQRDDTVQGGIRGGKYSLLQCIECHAVPDPEAGGKRTVRAFCSGCHEYAAVTIDCFQCHSDEVQSAKAPLNGKLPPGHPDIEPPVSGSLAVFADVERYLNERKACYALPRS